MNPVKTLNLLGTPAEILIDGAIARALAPPGLGGFASVVDHHFWWWEFRLALVAQWTFARYSFVVRRKPVHL
jgi:hypothetical protein